MIDELCADPDARLAFLEQAEVDGLLLAVSVGGGADGSRTLPLLQADADFDLARARFAALLRRADDHVAGRVLAALAEALTAVRDAQLIELSALCRAALETTSRSWTATHQVLPLPTLEGWLRVSHLVGDAGPTPVVATWAALEPAHPFADPLRAADWIALAAALHAWRPDELRRLAFPDRYDAQLRELRVGCVSAPEHPVWREIAGRLARLGLSADAVLDALAWLESNAEPTDPARRDTAEWEPAARDIVDRILDDL